MGPDVPDADYRRWVAAFAHMESRPEFVQMRDRAGLYPVALSGDAPTRHISQAVATYSRQVRKFKLVREN